jgi:hypothetical protein
MTHLKTSNPDSVIASEAKQSINRLKSMSYGSPRPLRGLAMTVFRGVHFLKPLSIKLFIAILFLSNPALSSQELLIYRDPGHKGDENQARGVIKAYSNVVRDVEVKEFYIGQEKELIAAVNKPREENANKPIVIAVGEKTVASFAQLVPLKGATTIHLCHMVTTDHPALLDKVDYLALPTHSMGDFANEIAKTTTQLIKTTGVAHNRQIEDIEKVYKEQDNQIPSRPAYLGIILAGDAANPDKTISLFTKANATELARYVASVLQDKHLLIINGPRTGKYDSVTLEEIKTAHRTGQPDVITQAFVDALKERGVQQDQFTLFDFQFGKSTGKEMDLVLGAIRATNSTILVPGESTSSISESVDVLPSGAVVVYPNTAMNDVHRAHVKSEFDAGRIRLLSIDFQQESKPENKGEQLPQRSAAATIASVLKKQ